MNDEVYKLILDKFKENDKIIEHIIKTFGEGIRDLQEDVVMLEQILSKIISKNQIISEKEAQEIAEEALKAIRFQRSENSTKVN